MTHNSSVSIIVLNWNGKKYLETCLSSLLEQSYQNIEIIFVDNGSSDGSVDYVKSKFPTTIIVPHKKNLGFTAGINSGIEVSHGTYIATINNDAEADREWISELVKVMESDHGAGSCASKMLNYYERDTIDSAGIVIYQNGNAYDRGAREKDKGQYDTQEEIFGACAGAALYRKEMFDDLGLFDKDYFAYFEDVDLSFRMQLHGWKCIYVPHAIVYHMHSATSKPQSPFKIFHLERNKLWNMWKYFPLKILIRQSPYTNIHYFRYLSRFFNKIIYGDKSIRSEDPILNYSLISIAIAVIRAKMSAYLKLPHIIKKRRRLMDQKSYDLEKWIIKDRMRKY